MPTVEEIDRVKKGECDVLTIDASATAVTAAEKMRHNHVGCLLVIDEKKGVVGILTERDITCKVVAVSADPAKTPVANIMTPKVVSCTMNTPLTKAQQLMAQFDIRHLPIIEGGSLVGMISSRDILAHQLSTVRAIARRQSKILNELEDRYPGITQLEKDPAGRIVI